jgi:hypothetical protein
MIRKYNYTGRVKIPNEFIKIFQSESNGVKKFDCHFNLEGLGLPLNAKVYVEPYFKASFMRFDFGTVSRIIQPQNTALIDIPITDRVLYRIKIVDNATKNGLILGFADEIISNSGESDSGYQPLLPVDFNSLGNRIWKLEFREEGPVLSVNTDQKIEKIRELVINDSKFLSFVFPEVIRQIAYRIISNDEIDLIEDSDNWQSNWMKYFESELNIFLPENYSDEEIRLIWSDEVSDSFCRKNKIIELLTN